MKILVVDDDPEIVELFVDVLERDGRFEVKTASTGYDAGILTQEFMPDLLILDYMLPDINGNIVCQTIRPFRSARTARRGASLYCLGWPWRRREYDHLSMHGVSR